MWDIFDFIVPRVDTCRLNKQSKNYGVGPREWGKSHPHYNHEQLHSFILRASQFWEKGMVVFPAWFNPRCCGPCRGGEELNRILCDRLEARWFWCWGRPGDVSPQNGGKRQKRDETMLVVWWVKVMFLIISATVWLGLCHKMIPFKRWRRIQQDFGEHPMKLMEVD